MRKLIAFALAASVASCGTMKPAMAYTCADIRTAVETLSEAELAKLLRKLPSGRAAKILRKCFSTEPPDDKDV